MTGQRTFASSVEELDMLSQRTQARVLIVDDNEVVRTALAGLIRGDRHFAVVGQATGGQAALGAIRSTNPDLVCLDVQMNDIDGLSILEQIRDKHMNIRVVMITAQSTPHVVQRALSLGARGFVIKPFTAEKVLRALHRAVM